MWKQLGTQTDANFLSEKYRRFHDPVLKEFHVVANLCISDPTLPSALAQNFDNLNARIMLQCQWPSPTAIDIVVEEVLTMNVHELTEIGNATIEVRQPGEVLGLQEAHVKIELGSNEIIGRRIYWMEQPGWIGMPARFGDEIPLRSKDAFAGPDGWIVCPNCADAWRDVARIRYTACPRCRQVVSIKCPAKE